MKYKFVLLLFSVVFSINTFIFFNRSDYVFKKQLTYIELYPTVSSLALKNIDKINDSSIKFNLLNPLKSPVKWYVLVNGIKDSQVLVNPILKLENYTNTYTILSPAYTDSLILRIEYLETKNGSNSFIGKYRSNEGLLSLLEIKGQDDIFKRITDKQQQKILNILQDSIHISKTLPTNKKIELIFVYLHKKLFTQRGTPDSSTLNLNAFEQYEAAIKGKKIWCGIYTNILNLFGTQANVKCRFLEIKNNFGNIQGSTHEVSEYFCPEKKQWIAVDLMFNILETTNANGHILNTVEVKNVHSNDSSVKVLQVKESDLVQNKYCDLELPFFDFYGMDKDIYLYNTSAEKFNGGIEKKIRNYTSRNVWYGCYSDINLIDNFNFYIKIVFLLLFFVFGIWTLMLTIIKIKNND